MRNLYAGPCMNCGKRVAAGDGHPHKLPRGTYPRWAVRCIPCVEAGREARLRADAEARADRLPYKDD